MRGSKRLTTVCVLCLAASTLEAQDNRVFRTTPETIALWEFNDLLGVPGDVPPNGTVISDVSGNGHNATVKGNSGALQVGGDPQHDELCDPAGVAPDLGLRRAGSAGSAYASTDGDGTAFEFDPEQDFSIELFVVRAENSGGENWGILAGTWHSRNLADDSICEGEAGTCYDNNGAWYGYGLIRDGNGDWVFNMSLINPDRSFTTSFNELKTSPPFEIPVGSHYLAISIDRESGTCDVYLDGPDATGNPISSASIPPGMAFYTPTGHEPSNFAFLTGVDDASRGAYRTCPTGYTITAARVQSRALDLIEVEDNVFLVEDCLPIPFGDDVVRAVITSSSSTALVDQCVILSAENSTPGEAESIESYEWKVGDGPFTAGGSVQDVSFDDPSGEGGVVVMLRVTDSAGNSDEAALSIDVVHPLPTAVVRGSRGAEPLGGDTFWLRDGDVLNLDGTGSLTEIQPGILLCPSVDGTPLSGPPVTDYRWDLDSDGAVDDATANPSLTVSAPDEFTITLTVINEVGAESSSSVDVVVIAVPDDIEPAPPGRIFLPDDDTIGIWEFNDLADAIVGETVGNDTVVPDLSGNGLDAVVEGNDLGELTLVEGDLSFDDNTGVARTVPRSPPAAARVTVLDPEEFEFGETQDFSIELFVRRDAVVGGENWGLLAGTWHSRNMLDENVCSVDDWQCRVANGAWYGYGFIREGNGDWLFNMSPIGPDRSFSPSFNEIKTPAVRIPEGSHYLVATVRRSGFGAGARIYFDGEYRGRANLPSGLGFYTPFDHDPARMMFFAGEDDLSRGEYRAAPTGFSIDAARVSRRALTDDEVEENHRLIRAGVAVPTQERVEPADGFVRGDTDSSGSVDLSDGVQTLNFLFLGGTGPACADSADVDDDGSLAISDAVNLFNYLFLGGQAPQPPAPTSTSYLAGDCGADPTEDNLDCATLSATCAG